MDRLPVFELLMNADPVVKGVMLILAAASIICWTIAFEKLMRILAFSRQVSALERWGASRGKASDWLADRMREIADAEPFAEGETQAECNARLEKSLQMETSAQLQRLRSGLPFLATVGSTAPFVGLFGTVWGIMRSFTGIAAAKDTSLAVVAPGIAEALFATAIGLAAAIPAVIFYNQANVSLGRLADRLSAAVVKFAKLRVYGEAHPRPAVNSKPASVHVTQGLTNGGLEPR
jgi:biopolymer transport protein ExbB/TolQ